jgi:Polyketide cyclase / dehydrase and lipid transport
MATNTLAFSVTQPVRASNDAVWKLLGDFGNEHRWTRTLTRCERDTPDVRVGTTRMCTLPRPLMGRTQVREELTEFEPGVALAYVLDGPAGPFLTASSRWSTKPGDHGLTLVTVEGNFTPRNWLSRRLVWPLAKPMIERLTRSVVRELETFVQSAH